ARWRFTEEETMAEKVELKEMMKPIASEGLITSFVTQPVALAEKFTSTTFGVARDIQGELSQRILDVITLVDGTQQGLVKLLRGLNGRVDQVSDALIDTLENLTVGTLRAVRDTGRNVTDLAGQLGKSRDVSRAA